MIIRYNVILPYSIASTLVLDWAENEGPIGMLGLVASSASKVVPNPPIPAGSRRRLAPS